MYAKIHELVKTKRLCNQSDLKMMYAVLTSIGLLTC